MVRPRKCRRVNAPPDVSYFKPRGVALSDLNEIVLSVDGYEALRLADLQGLKHEDAAARMQVSRQTFGRILYQARQTVAKALTHGWALCIRGGDYNFDQPESDSCCRRHLKPGRQASGANAQEVSMTRIAITSEGPTLDDALDPRFGRAAGFVIVDPQTLAFEYVDNGASQAMAQGAGIQAAEMIAKAGAKVLLTGYVGPKAFMALAAVGIKVAQNLENMSVRQAVERYNAGQVTWAEAPNRMGHGR